MSKLNYRIVVFILIVVFVAACEPASTSTEALVAELPTPTATVSTSAVAQASVLPTVTALPSAVMSLPPSTKAPPTEDAMADTTQDAPDVMERNQVKIAVGDNVLTATLAENSSVDALKEVLLEGPLTIEMRDYGGMEKVGSLGMNLPRNDEQITTEAGDIILYQGDAFVLYYAPNSWNFTRLGKVNNVSADELKEILGDGDVTITLSLP